MHISHRHFIRIQLFWVVLGLLTGACNISLSQGNVEWDAPVELSQREQLDMLFSGSGTIVPEPELQGDIHIGILNAYDAHNPVIELLMDYHYPNIQITYHLFSEDLLRTALLTGRSEMDILILDTDWKELVDKYGLLADLSTIPGLAFWPESMIDIKDLCEFGGQWTGFPRELSQLFWIWNIDLAAKVGIETPRDGWTWADLVALAQSDVYDLDQDKVNDLYLMWGSSHVSGLIDNYCSDMLDQYYVEVIENGGVFNTEAFRTLLKQFKILSRSGTLLSINSPVRPQFQDEEAVLIRFASGVPNVDDFLTSTNITALMPPLLDEKSIHYVGSMNYFCLLADAPHRDLAEKMFALMASPQALNCYSVGRPEGIFQKSQPLYVMGNDAFDPEFAFLQSEGETTQTYKVTDTSNYFFSGSLTYSFDDNQFAPMQVYREKAFLWRGSMREYYQTLVPLLKMYLDETLDEETVILRLDEQLEMIRGE